MCLCASMEFCCHWKTMKPTAATNRTAIVIRASRCSSNFFMGHVNPFGEAPRLRLYQPQQRGAAHEAHQALRGGRRGPGREFGHARRGGGAAEHADRPAV